MGAKVPRALGFDFLIAEVDVGFNYTWIALAADPRETDKIRRNLHNAERAYDSVIRYQEFVDLQPAQEEQLNTKLLLLARELRKVVALLEG